MRGVTFPGDREIAFVEFPDPTPGVGEVVLEVKASGMCGSDLRSYRRPKGTPTTLGFPGQTGPIIAGHEPCGVVAAVGAGVTDAFAKIGDRVMVHHYQGCTCCNLCRSGWQQLCQDAKVRVYGNNDHGAHARYLKVPASTLVKLPNTLSFATGAAISCGTGTAYGALRRLGLSGNDSISIFGQGPVGLSATQLAKAMGARVIALDISAERLEHARQLGADVCVNPDDGDAVAAIREITHGYGTDLSLDATGKQEGRLAAVQSLRVWGKTCFVGEGTEFHIDASKEMLRKQITVIGSWTFSTIGQAECAQFVADRNIDVEALFTHRWKLDQAKEAYELFDTQTTGKAVFLM
jgi:threonine dehydrogenase-like Zn-dependent dehydrogenase